jgi:glutaredoxin
MRLIEIFSAGCPVCEEIVKRISEIGCDAREIRVLDMRDPQVAQRANELGIRAVPAVVIDGKLADCCADAGPDLATLRSLVPGREK